MAVTLPPPIGSDLVRMSVEGVELFSAPFNTFQLDSGVWKTRVGSGKDGVWVKLDLTNETIDVKANRVNMAQLSTGNGVTIEVQLGAATAVETVPVSTQGNSHLYTM